jgi:hypothetical protein
MEATGIAKLGVTDKVLQVLLYVAHSSSEETLDLELITEECQTDYWRIPSFIKLQAVLPKYVKTTPEEKFNVPAESDEIRATNL